MPPRGIGTPSRRRGSLESSHIDDENPTVETPAVASPARAQDKEFQDSEGENPSITDGADEDYQDNVVSGKTRIKVKTSRNLRSTASKQDSAQLGSPTLSQTETPNPKKRGHEKHEDEVIRPGKRGRKPAVQTEVKNFETTIYGLLDDFKSKAHGFEASKTKNQELRLQFNALKKEHKKAQQALHHQEELEELQSSKIDQLQNECRSLRRMLEKAIDDARQDSGRYTKFSDSDITTEWGQLAFNVRGLVTQCFTKRPVNECDSIETLMRQLGRRSSLSVCDIASLRVAVLRRLIWEKVILGVLLGKRPIWHGAAGQLLTQIVSIKGQKQPNNPHCLEMISHMKLRAMNDFNEEPQLDETTKEAINGLIDATRLSLWQFLPSCEVENFQKRTMDLTMAARNLHTMMMKSKAIFFLRWLGDGDGKQLAQYDPESMEAMQSHMDAHTLQNDVEFVEAPALVKYGNADGEGFEFSTTLCKASVVLRDVEIISTSEDETMPSTASHDKASDDLSNAATKIKSEPEQ
ncbi:uncharacterized protein TrAtP1_004242 [Trichoderma atroviride]|uniref:uncharacterized protein n=1 Tax=Hypocrea atroviridis TaxID=63577 RepID=UPI00333375AA|nr:hypothetical protein TrAtP1_004242 [Trichoderma atroviride]